MPATLEHYIHRVGRTARAGRSGVSVSLAGEAERRIVKEVVKSTRNPVKSRLIPLDIIEKYRHRVQALQSDVEQILNEEWAEKNMEFLENKANRVEKMLKGEKNTSEQRTWFQTQKERKEEKERLKLTASDKPIKNSSKKEGPNIKNDLQKKKKARGKETADDRVHQELQKVMLLQARLAKRRQKMGKLRALVDEDRKSASKKSRKDIKMKSSFVDDLTDVSRKSVKKIRYEANFHNKMEKLKKKSTGKHVSRNNKSRNQK